MPTDLTPRVIQGLELNERKSANFSVPVQLKVIDAISSTSEIIESYFFPIKMQGYHCKRCGNTLDCRQDTYIMDPPKVLILQLDRSNTAYGVTEKNKDMIINDADIDISSFVLLPEKELDKGYEFKYSLYGVIVHRGTLEYGHYTAFIKQGDKWYSTSDTIIKETETQFEHSTAEAHVLFYERVPSSCRKPS